MKRLICCLLMLLLTLMAGLSAPVWSEEESSELPDVNGLWRFHLTAGDRHRSLTMKFEQNGDRLEGWLYDQSRSHPKIKGRIDEGSKILVWTRYEDRTGSSEESTFRGTLEGERIVGRCELWRKSYDFVAEPVKETDDD